MKWFKMYSEARSDNKLRVLDDSEFRAWFNLLCMAAEQKTRGTIEGRSFRIIAIEVCGGQCDLLRTLLGKLVGMEMIDFAGGAKDDDKCEITFLKFDGRQTDYPSNNPEAVAKRVQRHRQKPANVTTCNDNVTSGNDCNDKCNEDVTTQNRIDKNREEENKKDGAGAPGPLSPDSEIGMAVRALCRKTSLELSSFDSRDLKNLLVSFDARRVPVSKVEEFGRKWPLFWKGAKGAPPGIRDVMEQWDVVLALSDPGGEGGSIRNSDGSINPAAARRRGAELSGGGVIPRR